MMRTLKLLVGLGAIATLGMVSIHGVYGLDIPGAQSAAQIHARLTDQARAALRAGGHGWAQLRFEGQVAILEGVAPSVDARAAAVRAVADSAPLGGVMRVISLAAVEADGPYEWRGSRDGDMVILRGHVPSEVARVDLLESARVLFPNGVVDQMQVQADGVPNGDWLGAARAGLQALAKVNNGDVVLAGEALLLTGETGSPDQSRMAELALSSVVAPFVAQARISDMLTEEPQPDAVAPQLRPVQD